MRALSVTREVHFRRNRPARKRNEIGRQVSHSNRASADVLQVLARADTSDCVRLQPALQHFRNDPHCSYDASDPLAASWKLLEEPELGRVRETNDDLLFHVTPIGNADVSADNLELYQLVARGCRGASRLAAISGRVSALADRLDPNGLHALERRRSRSSEQSTDQASARGA